MLTAALDQNPDIRVAEAKVREAEAELNKVRVHTLQKVITLRAALESQKRAVEKAQDGLKSAERLHDRGFSSQEQQSAAAATLAQEKEKMAALDADLAVLMGRIVNSQEHAQLQHWMDAIGEQTRGTSRIALGQALNAVAFSPDGKLLSTTMADGSVRIWDASTGRALNSLASDGSSPSPAKGPMAERIRQALDKPITLKVEKKKFNELLSILRREVPGVPFHAVGDTDVLGEQSFDFDSIPLGAALQAIEDSVMDVGNIPGNSLRFAVRDYGILVTTGRHWPAGAVRLHDFWKRKADAATGASLGQPPGSPERNPPAQAVEGTVKAVDTEAGLVTLTVGSDAGLTKGNTLEVYRLQPAPTYLGRVRILAVKPSESVASPVDPSRGPIRATDLVTNSLRRQ
jgi:hypothetical protein